MSTLRLLAFGGPLNEQVVDVDASASVWLSPLPVRTQRMAEEPPLAPSFRHVEYRVKRVGFHDLGRCDAPVHTSCLWEHRCLVADGFPEDRITDALNAIAGMTRLLSVGAPS